MIRHLKNLKTLVSSFDKVEWGNLARFFDIFSLNECHKYTFLIISCLKTSDNNVPVETKKQEVVLKLGKAFKATYGYVPNGKFE